MRAAAVLCVMLAIGQLVMHPGTVRASEESPDTSCRAIEGVYEFVGRPEPGSQKHILGLAPNIGLMFQLGGGVVLSPLIDRFRVIIGQERPWVELYTRQGLLERIPLTGERDFAYCLDDELTIDRYRRQEAGTVHEYNRYRHRLRRIPPGDLLVVTEVTGKNRTWLLSWPREPERYAALFARRP